MSHTTLCKNLITSLYGVGYTDELIEILAMSPLVLRQILPIIAAQTPPQAPDLETKIVREDLMLHEVGYRPLPLDVRGCANFITARNKGLPAGQRAEAHHDSFYQESNFGTQSLVTDSKMMLIDTEQGKLPVQEACNLVKETLPEEYTTNTSPWLIFEILRTFWGHFSEINAAYVMVGVRAQIRIQRKDNW